VITSNKNKEISNNSSQQPIDAHHDRETESTSVTTPTITNTHHDNETEEVTSDSTQPTENNNNLADNYPIHTSQSDTMKSASPHPYKNPILHAISATNFYKSNNHNKKIQLMEHYDSNLADSNSFYELHILLIISLNFLKNNKSCLNYLHFII
jgi:hypothetical protein